MTLTALDQRMLLESIDDARTDAFTQALSDVSSVKVSIGRVEGFNDLAVALDNVDTIDRVEVLTDDDTATELRDHFLIGTILREYTRDETMEIRTESTPLPTLILSGSAVAAVTGFPDFRQIVLETANKDSIEENTEAFSQLFEGASTVELRQPPYTELVNELEERFDGAVRADFEEGLQAASDSDLPSLSLHPSAIGILVGALHELQFYEVGRWGEDTRMASKATFSRMKQRLEEVDVIEVESVQRQVGRPRHRLLAGEELEEAHDMRDMVEEAICV